MGTRLVNTPFMKIQVLQKKKSQDALWPFKRFCFSSEALKTSKKDGCGLTVAREQGYPLQQHRLTWYREDLAAEGHGAEDDGQGSPGDLHDAEQVDCGLACQESRDGSRHSLLAASFCFVEPSPLLFIGSPVDGEMESGGEVGNF